MSYAFQDCWYTEEITNAGTQNVYAFGLTEASGKRHIDFKGFRAINSIEQLGQAYPSLTAGNFPLDSLPGSFVPTNGLLLYWMLGDSSSAAGVHTITPLNSGTKPEIWILTNSNDDLIYQAHNCILRTLTLRFRLGEPMYAQCDWMGKEHENSNGDPATITHPSSVDYPFDNFDTCTWDGSGSADNLLVEEIVLKFTQKLVGYMGSNGYYAYIAQNNPIISGVTINFKRDFDVNGSATVWADLWTGTTGTLVFKIKKASDATKYIKFTFTNMLCADVNVQRTDGEPPSYFGSFAGANMSFEVVDGVADSFYGD